MGDRHARAIGMRARSARALVLPREMRSYTVLWAGQLISVIGSGMTTFAIGVWMIEQTRSLTLFTFVYVAAVLPGVVIAPLAGVIVDRWSPSLVLRTSVSAGALLTLALAAAFATDAVEVWSIYATVAAISVFAMSHYVAFTVATVSLVPLPHLARANGALQLAQSARRMCAPLAAGLLLPLSGVQGVLLIDSVSYMVALATLMAVFVPRVSDGGSAQGRSWSREALAGWRFVRDRSDLAFLLVAFACFMLLTEFSVILFQPRVLGLGSPAQLGAILSLGGVGFLAGSLVVTAWRGPTLVVRGQWIAAAVLGLGVATMGLTDSLLAITASTLLVYFTLPFALTLSQLVWLREVPRPVQGRVFALRRMVMTFAQPLAYVLAGPLVALGLTPLAGALASVGLEPGGGAIALAFILFGGMSVSVALFALRHGSVRRLDAPAARAVAAPGSASSS